MVDYEFYSENYKGKVKDINEFEKLARISTSLLEQHSLGRINRIKDENLINKVKYTICELIDGYYDFNNQPNVKSESSGPYSKTYTDNKSQKELELSQVMIIRRNLLITGLLYRGV